MYETSEQQLDNEVARTLQIWTDAIARHDRVTLERIHDDDFTCIELAGTSMDRATHIEMELKADDIAMEFFDVRNHGFQDTVITWARQTISGKIPGAELEDDLTDETLTGIEFVFTLVWRRAADGLQVYTFHASRVWVPDAASRGRRDDGIRHT
jgi:hypothetical protein